MEKQHWFKDFPAAITITNQDGIILDMNDHAAAMFSKDGGYELIGSNAFNCHPEPARTKLLNLFETHSSNVYSITKDGQKKLIYQAPYFTDGIFSGMVEICLKIPEDIPHFDRDHPDLINI